jgi:hypothetical protein
MVVKMANKRFEKACFLLAFLFLSCEGTVNQKRIVVSGIDHRAYNGMVVGVLILESLDPGIDPVAFGGIKISGTGNVVVPLKSDNQLASDWNESGEFYIVLLLPDLNSKASGIKELIYTDGVTPNQDGSNIPKYRIAGSLSKIALNQFYDPDRETPVQNNSMDNGNTHQKSIVITDIDHSAYNGLTAAIQIMTSPDSNVDPVAFGEVRISGTGDIVIPLKSDDQLVADWNGYGEFYIMLALFDANAQLPNIKAFIYTNGIIPNQDGSNIPRYSIAGDVSKIVWNQLYELGR